MKIAIASDHAGFKYKEQIKIVLIEQGHEVRDLGTHSNESCDYPDFIRPAAEAVAAGKAEAETAKQWSQTKCEESAAHSAGTCARQDSAANITTQTCSHSEKKWSPYIRHSKSLTSGSQHPSQAADISDESTK